MSQKEDERKVWFRGRLATLGEVRSQMRLDALNETDLRALKALLEKDEPMTAGELARELNITKAYAYIIVNKKLTPKYAVKIGKPTFLVGLTEEGLKAAHGTP